MEGARAAQVAKSLRPRQAAGAGFHHAQRTRRCCPACCRLPSGAWVMPKAGRHRGDHAQALDARQAADQLLAQAFGDRVRAVADRLQRHHHQVRRCPHRCQRCGPMTPLVPRRPTRGASDAPAEPGPAGRRGCIRLFASNPSAGRADTSAIRARPMRRWTSTRSCGQGRGGGGLHLAVGQPDLRLPRSASATGRTRAPSPSSRRR